MVSINDPAAGAQPSARDDLASVDAARHSSVYKIRRPKWVLAAVSTSIGMGFGILQLDTFVGWILGALLIVLGVVGFPVLDRVLRRRRGRLLNLSNGSALRSVVMVAVVFLAGQINSPSGWQPWFALALGVVLSMLSYLYLSHEDSVMARKLATGDFSPDDLMP